MKDQTEIIGYAGLDIREDCYEYFENECCIADTIELAEYMMKESYSCMGPYKITPITISEIMNDFGYSYGSFAFEKEAFSRFKEIAAKNDIPFTSRIDTMAHPPLVVVEVSGVKTDND